MHALAPRAGLIPSPRSLDSAPSWFRDRARSRHDNQPTWVRALGERRAIDPHGRPEIPTVWVWGSMVGDLTGVGFRNRVDSTPAALCGR